MNIKDLTMKQMFSLATDAYKGISSDENYTAQERREGMNALLKEMAQDFRNNETKIYEIIEKIGTQELPQRIEDSIGRFTDAQPFGDGDKVEFILKNGKIKAVTVALGSTVKRQRVDNRKVPVETEAIQAKVYEHIKRVKAGLVDFVELTDDVLDAIEEVIYQKVFLAMTGAYATMPAANKHSDTTFTATEFDRILSTVKAYGNPVIFGTFAAVSTIPFDESDASKDDKRNQGYVGRYKGADVVAIANSFEDEENTIKTISDEYLFVVPAGKEKLVKLALEGGLNVRGEDGKDWTKNFEAMQEAGVAVLTVNNWGAYRNTSLA